MRSKVSLPKTGFLFVREFKENGVWLFVVSLLLVLVEPFSLYLSGITSEQLEGNRLWYDNYIKGFNPAFYYNWEHLVQVLFSFIFFLALTFLSYHLFSFFFEKKSSDMWFSFPISRGKLFAGKYFAGLALILVPLLIDFLIMLPLFFSGPAHLEVFFTGWLLKRLRFLLLLVNFYSIAVLSIILAGSFAEALLINVTIQLVMPALFSMGYNYMQDSASGYFGWTELDQYKVFTLSSPALRMLVEPMYREDAVSNLVLLVVLVLLCIFAFMRRPSERTGSRLGERKGGFFLGIVWTVFVGMFGGLFIEGVLNRQSVAIYFFFFLLFGFFGLMVYRLFVKAKIRGRGLEMAVSLGLSLFLLLAFTLSVELGYTEKARTIAAEELESMIHFNYAQHPWRSKANEEVLFSREADPELFSKLVSIYQEAPRLAKRQGFINREAEKMHEAWDVLWKTKDGQILRGKIAAESLPAVKEEIGKSALYAPCLDLGSRQGQDGDVYYLYFRVFDNSGEDKEEEAADFLEKIKTYPFLQELKKDDPFFSLWGEAVIEKAVNSYDAEMVGASGYIPFRLDPQEGEILLGKLEEDYNADDKFSLPPYQTEPFEYSQAIFEELGILYREEIRLFVIREVDIPHLSPNYDEDDRMIPWEAGEGSLKSKGSYVLREYLYEGYCPRTMEYLAELFIGGQE